MKTHLDCIPCFMSQAIRAGRIVTDDENKIKQILDSLGAMIKDIPMDMPPPETASIVYQGIREITGVDDPYSEIKKSNIKEALSLHPKFKKIVTESNNRLLTAIRIAIGGNVIDLGVNKEFNIDKDITEILQQDFAILHFKEFINELNKAKSVLYIGDNAGESVFDKILIEELGKPVTYAVRGIPIINDVTYDDAIASGLDDVTKVISSGSKAPGTILESCNKEFLRRFNDADLIISKGQGNYEGLSNVKRTVFFLLKAKCHIIANNLGVKENDIVLKMI